MKIHFFFIGVVFFGNVLVASEEKPKTFQEKAYYKMFGQDNPLVSRHAFEKSVKYTPYVVVSYFVQEYGSNTISMKKYQIRETTILKHSIKKTMQATPIVGFVIFSYSALYDHIKGKLRNQ